VENLNLSVQNFSDLDIVQGKHFQVGFERRVGVGIPVKSWPYLENGENGNRANVSLLL